MKKHLCSNTVFSFSQYGHCQTFKLPSGEFELSKDPEKEGREALEKYKMSDSHGFGKTIWEKNIEIENDFITFKNSIFAFLDLPKRTSR